MDRNEFHVRLIEAVLKHTKEPLLLSEWIRGRLKVKFWRGTQAGYYRGGRMFLLDSGGSVDADPASVTGVTFEDTVVDEDAEFIVRSLSKEKDDLKNQFTLLRQQIAEVTNERDALRLQLDAIEGKIDEISEDVGSIEDTFENKDEVDKDLGLDTDPKAG